jgi:hypothetical protein
MENQSSSTKNYRIWSMEIPIPIQKHIEIPITGDKAFLASCSFLIHPHWTEETSQAEFTTAMEDEGFQQVIKRAITEVAQQLVDELPTERMWKKSFVLEVEGKKYTIQFILQ